MALTILNEKNRFVVEGKINSNTANNFKTHLNLILNSLNDVTVDISKVTEIDTEGLAALKAIYEKALYWRKSFSIVGYGCKEIYDEFRMLHVA